MGGRFCIWRLFLYRPAPPCILPVYCGFLALGSFSFFFDNLLLSLLIKKKRDCANGWYNAIE